MAFDTQTYTSTAGHDVAVVTGAPDCLAFYKWLHAELAAATLSWPPPAAKLAPGRRGNLGEFIVLQVFNEAGFDGPDYKVSTGGAATPLHGATHPGLDITVVYLDPQGIAANDRLYVIEVKTTGRVSLSYANALIDDYQKLLGGTKVSSSLAIRMNYVIGQLKAVHKLPKPLIQRAKNLFQVTPAQCAAVKLVPTLLHDRKYGDPVETMGAVAEEIHLLGWRADCIEPWSISISRLNLCLLHLSNNSAFRP